MTDMNGDTRIIRTEMTHHLKVGDWVCELRGLNVIHPLRKHKGVYNPSKSIITWRNNKGQFYTEKV